MTATNATAMHEGPDTGLRMSDGTRPILSVVIPAYNVSPYVTEAIASALGQTLRNLEVVVVDDGSTDQTPDILRELQRRRADNRLRVVTQTNAGLAAARNAGILNSIGEFIGFLDADDIWMPEKAELQVRAMLHDPEIGISFSHSAYITEEGHRTGTVLSAENPEPSLHSMIRRNHVGNGSTPVVRRDCFDIAGLFRPELRSCEDYEMWCRILWQTPYRAALVNEPLTLYRLRHSSLSFNSKGFTSNANLAISCLRQAMPNVPDRVFRAGHAEHYRIAAWKAVSSGKRRTASALLAQAAWMRPSLLLRDWRAVCTAVSLLLPSGVLPGLVRFAKKLQGRTLPSSSDPAAGRRDMIPELTPEGNGPDIPASFAAEPT